LLKFVVLSQICDPNSFLKLPASDENSLVSSLSEYLSESLFQLLGRQLQLLTFLCEKIKELGSITLFLLNMIYILNLIFEVLSLFILDRGHRLANAINHFLLRSSHQFVQVRGAADIFGVAPYWHCTHTVWFYLTVTRGRG